ncbi:MAG: hypothetical protein ACI9G1_002277 [Pirellulaceae bacterium]|jgi:hypothetical protein
MTPSFLFAPVPTIPTDDLQLGSGTASGLAASPQYVDVEIERSLSLKTQELLVHPKCSW